MRDRREALKRLGLIMRQTSLLNLLFLRWETRGDAPLSFRRPPADRLLQVLQQLAGAALGAQTNFASLALGVADLTGLVDFLVGEAEVGGCRRSKLLFWKFGSIPALRLNLPPILGGIVLIGKAPLRQRFDFKRISLRVNSARSDSITFASS
ncbi:MAG: hypothetical protein ACR65W_03950 [Methylocystis sp.]|uniref:hypothetical protein n=1 Tax=Methylocystis sp. TaxID=1911079 RepID=UPI003DA30B7B